MNAALAGLHDIHLPPPPGWWPPAPGWWAILVLALVLCGLLGTWAWRRWSAQRYRRVALRTLARIPPQPATRQVQHINALLKRAALCAYPQSAPAGLHGEAWVGFLTRHARLTEDEASALGILAEAPYRPLVDPMQAADVAAAAQTWLRRHR